jgi:hypothetical protein
MYRLLYSYSPHRFYRVDYYRPRLRYSTVHDIIDFLTNNTPKYMKLDSETSILSYIRPR